MTTAAPLSAFVIKISVRSTKIFSAFLSSYAKLFFDKFFFPDSLISLLTAVMKDLIQCGVLLGVHCEWIFNCKRLLFVFLFWKWA